MKKAAAEILVGDCRAVLAQMADCSVNCCVTSPPYWGLRDYGVDGQIGLEGSVDAWVAELVAVFAQVRRVLRDDGTLWLNIGNAYSGSRRGGNIGRNSSTLEGSLATQEECRRPSSRRRDDARIPRSDIAIEGMRPKNLIGMPWRIAFALQADGWNLRSEIIWHKPNPMPESCRDRPTTSHEQIFLLTKSLRYHFDADSIAEPCSENTHARVSQDVASQIGSLRANGGTKTNGTMKAVIRQTRAAGVNPKAGLVDPGNHHGVPKANPSFSAAIAGSVLTRNARSVWTIPTQGYKGSHFATFPRELAARCIKAGCPAGGLVLDPFAGTGTTVAEAVMLGRRGVGIELNPDYALQARKRIHETCGLLAHGGAA